MEFQDYGTFSPEGLLVLERFHRLKELKQEVQFELKWLNEVFERRTPEKKARVTAALLDNENLQREFLAKSWCGQYNITSQELSTLCGERFLSDETINFLVSNY